MPIITGIIFLLPVLLFKCNKIVTIRDKNVTFKQEV